MPSKLTLRMLLAAVTLAALQLSASGAPLEQASTDSPACVEQREDSRSLPGCLNIFNIWKVAIATTEHHKEEFEEEFGGNVNYIFLNCTHPLFPVNCPSSNFNEEACFPRLAEGLLTYMVLLKHVEKEYPNSSIVTGVRNKVPQLIPLIKAKMKKSERVKVMTCSEEQQLLKKLDNPDAYTRKMRAHSILSSLRFFLIDGLRSLRQCETLRKQAALANTTN